jgi:GT2 family glycosyltransferase
MKNKINPWISILIPSYEYPEGVLRILNLIYISNEYNIECIVGDDSNSSFVESMVKSHKLYSQGKVAFIKNKNNLGAVKNWNNLVNLARGEYILLMHHDECPENTDFFYRLKELIKKSHKPDIIFLRCSLQLLRNKRLRYHMPFFLQTLFLKYVPDYLILHNIIGSPSNVVVRKDLYLEFDEELVWTVDVDWMVRLLRKSKSNWIFGRHLSIMSMYNQATSITTKLGSQIPFLRHNEIKKIQNKLGKLDVFYYIFPETWDKKLLSIFEKLCWILFRVITIFIGYFFNRPKPKWLKYENNSF